MSQQKDDNATNGGLGYQKKNNEEVEEIVNRLNTPKKKYEPKNSDRRRKIEPQNQMSQADIQAMVERLHSSKPHPKLKSAYEQGGVMASYWGTGWGHGWGRPGTDGKPYF